MIHLSSCYILLFKYWLTSIIHTLTDYNTLIMTLPSVRTSLQSSCWSTQGLCHWSPDPEPGWRSYNRPSLSFFLSPVWGYLAGGSEPARCRWEPGATLPARHQLRSPALPQPVQVSPFHCHFVTCSHRVCVTSRGKREWFTKVNTMTPAAPPVNASSGQEWARAAGPAVLSWTPKPLEIALTLYLDCSIINKPYKYY